MSNEQPGAFSKMLKQLQEGYEKGLKLNPKQTSLKVDLPTAVIMSNKELVKYSSVSLSVFEMAVEYATHMPYSPITFSILERQLAQYVRDVQLTLVTQDSACVSLQSVVPKLHDKGFIILQFEWQEFKIGGSGPLN